MSLKYTRYEHNRSILALKTIEDYVCHYGLQESKILENSHKDYYKVKDEYFLTIQGICNVDIAKSPSHISKLKKRFNFPKIYYIRKTMQGKTYYKSVYKWADIEVWLKTNYKIKAMYTKK